MVSPSAASAAMTSETEARRSVAMTGAPVSAFTPSMVARSPSSWICAPSRTSSCTCMKRFSKIVSVMWEVPFARVISAMSCAIELGPALDDDPRAAGARDLGAHLVEAIGDVGDLRFARGILDHGGATRERSRHQRGMSAADRHLGKFDLAAPQPILGAGDDVSAIDLDLGAEIFERHDQKVDRARTDGAAAGHRHL